jgi:hypothetical protein
VDFSRLDAGRTVSPRRAEEEIDQSIAVHVDRPPDWDTMELNAAAPG